MNLLIFIPSICLAIFGIFSYLEARVTKKMDEDITINLSEEIVKLYGDQFLPQIVDGVTDKVSDRMVRYLTSLVAEGVLNSDNCEEAITKTREAYHQELKGDKRGC